MAKSNKKRLCMFSAIFLLAVSLTVPMYVNAEGSSQTPQQTSSSAESIIQSIRNTLGSEYSDDFSSINSLGNVSGIEDLKGVAEQITNDEAIKTGWDSVKEVLKKAWDFIVYIWSAYIKPYAIRYPIYAVIIVLIIFLVLRSRRRRY